MKNQVYTAQSHQLPALTGIRFVAIFHIFFHHLWAVYTYYSGTSEQTQGLLAGLKDAPDWFMVFISNGWVSTSLFFMLSGFILAYLYWSPDGQLSTSKKQFWIRRFARIYPIHLLVLIILIGLKLGTYLDEGQSTGFLVGSMLGTAGLIQAWIPAFIPMWSWPTWTISVMVFLYLLMPFILMGLNRLSGRQHLLLLVLMPLISLIPAGLYAISVDPEAGWDMHTELFFSNFPLFWVPYFIAGILLTRVFSLSRFESNIRPPSRFALGDVALLLIIVIGSIPQMEPSLVYALRYGLLMPLYMMFIVDLARGNGIVAKLLVLPGMKFLGELGFSIFIWQAFVLAMAFISIAHFPQLASYHVSLAVMLVLSLAAISTYLIEKPIANAIRRRFADTKRETKVD